MALFNRLVRRTLGGALLVSASALAHPASPDAPQIRTEYAMRLHAPLFAPHAVGRELLIFHPKDGGYLSGPGLQGKVINPSGDWVRVLPNGNMKIDVRLTLKMDDGELVYMTYGGILKAPDPASWSRFMSGKKINAPEWYYVITPSFETTSKKYQWLNDVQGIGKFVSIQTGEDAHVAFDIFLVR